MANTSAPALAVVDDAGTYQKINNIVDAPRTLDTAIGQFKTQRAALLAAFPDLSVVVEATAADADVVVVRWTASGTHLGEGFGIRATGAPIAFRGMTWFVIRAGQFIEGWDAWNQGALVESLREAARTG